MFSKEATQFIGHIELQGKKKKKGKCKSLVLQAAFRAGNTEAAASICKGCNRERDIDI